MPNAMTVGELIQKLQTLEPEREVLFLLNHDEPAIGVTQVGVYTFVGDAVYLMRAGLTLEW